MTLIRPALLVHDFRRISGRTIPDGAVSRWAAVWTGLEMTLSGTAERPALPDDARRGETNVLQWAQRPRTGTGWPLPLHEAALWSTGDDLCISTILAPNSNDRSWTELEREFADRLPDSCRSRGHRLGDEYDLGGARVYQALLDRTPSEDELPELARLVADGLPDELDYDWTQQWSRTRQDFMLWELPATTDRVRRLVLLAHQDSERALDTFSWSPGEEEVGLLSKYLLDAAKLRYLDRAHRILAPELDSLRSATDRAATDLFALHSTVTALSPQLTTAEAKLQDIRIRAGGLADKVSRLQRIGHDVTAAETNIRANVPVRAEGAGPVAGDLTMAEQIRERVAHDVRLAQDSTGNADRVAASTAIVVQRGLSLNEQRIGVVQASLIGAILMVLAAIQALEPDLRGIPAGLHLPLIVMLGSLALALPNVLFRLSRNAPGDLPLKVFDRVAMVAAAGGVSWFGAQLVSYLIRGRFLGAWGVLACVGAGLAAMGGAAVLSARRRDQRT
ncbi:CATRA conflict system CASPASE/TPR repeat-associated protein [Micromonospora sp. RB23]